MKNYFLILILAFIVGGVDLLAQGFMRPVESFSRKKTSYITMSDGNEVEGKIKRIKYKKGLIKEIILKDEGGEETTIMPEEIKMAFLPQSGLHALGSALDDMYDLTDEFEDEAYGERIKEGYAFFEQQEVELKNEKRNALLQLVNPHYPKGIKVYHDPYAGETASLNAGGFKVAGGVDKSYYILPPGQDVAWRVKKKDYEDKLKDIYGDCDAATDDGKKRVIWSNFPNHVFLFQKNCL